MREYFHYFFGKGDRLIVMAAVITLMFFLAYLPWLIKDRRAKKAATPATNN